MVKKLVLTDNGIIVIKDMIMKFVALLIISKEANILKNFQKKNSPEYKKIEDEWEEFMNKVIILKAEDYDLLSSEGFTMKYRHRLL